MILNLRLAEAMTHAVVAHAEAAGLAVSVAVCGQGGRIVAFLKMDGTDALSGHEAMRRAITASGAGVPSELASGHEGAAVATSHEGFGLTRQPGGLPLMVGGECVGAVGVCGGTGEQAVACARAGLKLL